VQRAGIDFNEVFALVACLESVRMLVALVAHERWTVHHMDIKSEFLNGMLKEEVYVHQPPPPRFITAGNESKVLCLHKALYGLQQAPRAWNAKLNATMASLGFPRSRLEQGIYTRCREGRLIVGIYVDDLIITSTSDAVITEFKTEMQNQLQMSDPRLLTCYLGIEVQGSVASSSVNQCTAAKFWSVAA
jgi:hypothetical protein